MPPPPKKPPLLPPHLAWPLFVTALLVLGMSTTLFTVFMAQSDGGAQVEADYYRKAVAWDTTAAEQAASDALGWLAHLALIPGAPPDYTLALTVTDAAGQPVTGLSGTLQAFRPDRTAPLARAALTASEQPGLYRMTVALPLRGLWDFEIEAQRPGARFLATLRRERP